MVRASGAVELALIVQGFATLLLLNGIIRILLKTSLLLGLQQCQFGLFALLLHHIYTAGRGGEEDGVRRIRIDKKRRRIRKKSLLVQNSARLFKQPTMKSGEMDNTRKKKKELASCV